METRAERVRPKWRCFETTRIFAPTRSIILRWTLERDFALQVEVSRDCPSSDSSAVGSISPGSRG